MLCSITPKLIDEHYYYNYLTYISTYISIGILFSISCYSVHALNINTQFCTLKLLINTYHYNKINWKMCQGHSDTLFIF